MNALPKTRADAKASGVKHYFTAKACVNGHVTRRFVSNGSCEECANEQTIAWRKRNPEKAAECARAWRAGNPEKVAASKLAAKARNPDKARERERAYRKSNPEKRQAAVNSWKSRNLAGVVAYARDYRAKNKERFRAYNSTRKAIRRAIEEAGIGLGTFLGWTKTQPKVCFYCGVNCVAGFHVDHFIPLAKGGAHVLTNLRIACPPCNLRKGARDPIEWMEAA